MRTDLKIKSWLGCGLSFIGKGYDGNFRSRHYCGSGINEVDSFVEYVFITLFWLPIFPVGCKRIVNLTYNLETGNLKRAEEFPSRYGYVDKTKIIGDEKMKVGELIWIYAIWPLLAVFIYMCVLWYHSGPIDI